MSTPSATAFTFHRHFIEKLRADALRQWRPILLEVPTTLFLSDESLPEGQPDCGWSDLCRPLRLVPIGGTHASMMEPPYRERLCAKLVEAVAGTPPAA